MRTAMGGFSVMFRAISLAVFISSSGGTTLITAPSRAFLGCALPPRAARGPPLRPPAGAEMPRARPGQNGDPHIVIVVERVEDTRHVPFRIRGVHRGIVDRDGRDEIRDLYGQRH